ncbi:MAG TPA: SDR family NAD(P)-dependent oxidoreductase [Bacteroidia bacterium]|nr:SDR family NAD(P)-dependent oxidoreductase [Bacteroidia bacterium]
MKKLESKVVFITGGISGIGKASALAAANEGAIVVVADLAETNYKETIEEITNLGAKCLFVPIDVSDVNSVKKAISVTVEKFGRLDVAFNNAGIAYGYTNVHDTDEDLWDRQVAVNLTGQFYCIRYELQQFLKQGGGVIVNMASLGGLKAIEGLVAYTAAKHGVLGITKNIAIEYAVKNIRANAICPYYIETNMISMAPRELRKEWTERAPMKRMGNPGEIAKAFIFLASDDSSYCNGAEITLDGGVMA